MASYFAEVDGSSRVVRVVVADSVEWCVTNLGGTWVETSDPYSIDEQTVRYCGPGHGFDRAVPERFCGDDWDAAKATTQQLDDEGQWFWTYNTQNDLVFHAGRIWRNLLPSGTPNVWEPGVANWRQYTMGVEHPVWVQPTGAFDAYPVGFVVEHRESAPPRKLKAWVSTTAANVWEPGVFGWDEV